MGTLKRFILEDIACTVFFETGTGDGGSLRYAASYPQFRKLYSVEIHQPTALAAEVSFRQEPRITILNLDSKTALEQVLPTVPPEERIFFFLDAHYPGERWQDFRGHLAREEMSLKLPLEQELETIRRWRKQSRDVILIDDLRIYENGPFESGNMPDWAETLDPASKNIEFASCIFPDRELHRDYRDEGYLIIAPPPLKPEA